MATVSRRLGILIGAAALLLLAVAAVQWLSGGDFPPDPDAARIERFRRGGDVEALGRNVSNPDVQVAERAVEALGRLGLKARSRLRQALTEGHPKVREKAAVALGWMPYGEQAGWLAKAAVQDPSVNVRAAAVTALGQMEAYEQMDTLLAALDDEDPMVRRRAAAAIVRITRFDYGFRADDPSEKRRALAEGMRQKWANMKEGVHLYYTGPRYKRGRGRAPD